MSVAILFFIISAVCGAYYVYSCIRYPRVPCRWCGGKAPRDPLLRKPFGSCSHCGGKGYGDRLGTRMIGKGKR